MRKLFQSKKLKKLLKDEVFAKQVNEGVDKYAEDMLEMRKNQKLYAVGKDSGE